MTSTSLKPKIVRIEYKKGDAGLLFATSPDLKGLFVTERAMDAFERSIPAAIKDLYAACGVNVVVGMAEQIDQDSRPPWIAFPAELARQALEQGI